jgi:hydrogenase nickel incorporation protein HypA/HybF
MHEFSLLADLIKKIGAVAREHDAKRVVGVNVRLGALSQISPEHFREHFEHATERTLAEGARLSVVISTDIHDENAQQILLESVECEE